MAFPQWRREEMEEGAEEVGGERSTRQRIVFEGTAAKGACALPRITRLCRIDQTERCQRDTGHQNYLHSFVQAVVAGAPKRRRGSVNAARLLARRKRDQLAWAQPRLVRRTAPHRRFRAAVIAHRSELRRLWRYQLRTALIDRALNVPMSLVSCHSIAAETGSHDRGDQRSETNPRTSSDQVGHFCLQ